MISDGFIIVAKRDCPTCTMLEPVYRELADSTTQIVIYSQDDPTFPESVGGVVDDCALERSYRLGVETVPTLILMKSGQEVARTVGWHQEEGRNLTGSSSLGAGLPGRVAEQ